MTVMREGEETTPQTDGAQLGRTFAMILVAAGYVAITVGMAYFLIAIALPAADDPEVAAVIPRIAAVTAFVGVIGAVALVWSGVRHRAWFWLVAALPGLLIVILNAPDIAYDITHPANTEAFLRTILVLAGELAIIIGGITAFLEVRRSRPSWMSSGRAGWMSMAVVGVLLGAATTSVLAGSASTGGTEVGERPTVTGILTAETTTFVESNLHLRDGEVLGLFVTNKDAIGHSFDIDSLDIHMQLPPNSTTAVVIKPTRPGNVEFFCGVPGHREAGMVGTITVDA
ncbi:MAG TPA: cupredoxin domain-containing protein [Acidimicrobiia bacterium]|nr:cupredoxin domain-containing protein [Acidimicrobiia bacterium]